MRQYMPMVFDGMGRVTRDGDRSGAHDRQIGDDPFRPVFGDKTDTIAVAYPERSEAEGYPSDIGRRRRPGRR